MYTLPSTQPRRRCSRSMSPVSPPAGAASVPSQVNVTRGAHRGTASESTGGRHRRLVVNIVAGFVTFGATLVVGLWYTPYMIRRLGVAVYGLIPLSTSSSLFSTSILSRSILGTPFSRITSESVVNSHVCCTLSKRSSVNWSANAARSAFP